ncbi:MAG: hypothetical protein HQK72_03950 [Desulfamplus sp.]|nr:hypothetical protein [Desulfamplus sp.]
MQSVNDIKPANYKESAISYVDPINNLHWNQRFYLNLEKEVHPFNEPHLFRPLNRSYNGKTTFWSTPSPEPNLSDDFWNKVQESFKLNAKLSCKSLSENYKADENCKIYSKEQEGGIYKADENCKTYINEQEGDIYKAAQNLASLISHWQPNPEKIIFVSILRAGVPITEWLCKMLPGAVGVALSFFVGIGIDKIALAKIENDFPNRDIIFVDGWTGKGGVAREISMLNKGPLAVLIDPWGWADFAGVKEDIFCPSACFTGVATLGFSRTFFVDSDSLFSAYRFTKEFLQPQIIESWKQSAPQYKDRVKITKNIKEDTNKSDIMKFYVETDLRVHSNEVCRAFINAAPENLLFADDKSFAQENFSLLLELAEQRKIPPEFNVRYLRDLKTRAACKLLS